MRKKNIKQIHNHKKKNQKSIQLIHSKSIKNFENKWWTSRRRQCHNKKSTSKGWKGFQSWKIINCWKVWSTH
jgi:hypothetical protein